MGEGNEGVYIESWRLGRHVDGVSGRQKAWGRDANGVVRLQAVDGPGGQSARTYIAPLWTASTDPYLTQCAAAQIDSWVVHTLTHQKEKRHFTFTKKCIPCIVQRTIALDTTTTHTSTHLERFG